MHLCLPETSLICSEDHWIAVKSDTNQHTLRNKKNLKIEEFPQYYETQGSTHATKY
jgi:hypothetical protein